MCGVFGFVSANDRPPSMRRLRELATVTEARGRHAFGFAWIDARNRIRAFKMPGRITESLELLDMAADARMLIGHCRFATEGAPENNGNNHPLAADGGWIVHNGMIPSYAALYEIHDLWPTTECDSEVLALLVESLDGSLLARSAAAMRAIGDRDAAMLGLWSGPNRMVVARNGKPLQVGSTRNGTYFATLPAGLPRNAAPLPDGVVHLYSQNKIGDISVKEETISTPERRTRRRAAQQDIHEVERGCLF